MKYYSEILQKPFDTAEACTEAEQAFKDKQTAKSKRKKELAQAIEDCTAKERSAIKDYETAKEKAAAVLKAANEEATQIIADAKAALKDTQAARFEAIKKFNEEFGVYQVSYTSEEADEWLKHLTDFDEGMLSLMDLIFS